ncbi:hypothetical protein EJB05_47042, partial [Eragrostis curvula]
MLKSSCTLFGNIIITDDPALAKTFCRRDLGPAKGGSSRDEGHRQWYHDELSSDDEPGAAMWNLHKMEVGFYGTSKEATSPTMAQHVCRTQTFPTGFISVTSKTASPVLASSTRLSIMNPGTTTALPRAPPRRRAVTRPHAPAGERHAEVRHLHRRRGVQALLVP